MTAEKHLCKKKRTRQHNFQVAACNMVYREVCQLGDIGLYSVKNKDLSKNKKKEAELSETRRQRPDLELDL